jgi:chemotaxis signal transduction protein
MSTGSGAVEALRRAFDSEFGREPAGPVERVDLVAIRAGGQSHAVRVSEIGGVVPFAAVAPLPCDDAAMLGIAAIRGAPLPVYDLAALLGRSAVGSPRWMLLSAGAERVGFAFDEIEEHLRVPRESLVALPRRASTAGSPPEELVRGGSSLRPVLSMPALLAQLERRLGASTKGR